ncbi:hypothetical protein HPB52_018996 [Rhipicephalus sanguineus]|uniref:Uncharacterized protein n=1 Tax=Rhipicephalus sanguineus TaxID=34632 RepID=A0A9D4T7V7_RHISA|nr:hypothetical protein HPB52_018996 [Rhipicephalus sanguineus]
MYRALLAFHRRLKTTSPEIDVAEADMVDTMAAVVLPVLSSIGTPTPACGNESPVEANDRSGVIGYNDGRWYGPPFAPTASWLRPTDMRRSNAWSPDHAFWFS